MENAKNESDVRSFVYSTKPLASIPNGMAGLLDYLKNCSIIDSNQSYKKHFIFIYAGITYIIFSNEYGDVNVRMQPTKPTYPLPREEHYQ